MSEFESKGPDCKCSFCGKNQDEVEKLIAGPDVYICDECIELCNEIVLEEDEGIDQLEGKDDFQPGTLKPKEINDYLAQYVIGQERAKKILFFFMHHHPPRSTRPDALYPIAPLYL